MRTMRAVDKKYAHIWAWGESLGSYPYYMRNQCDKAESSNAPENAIYERDGVWSTADQIKDEDTRQRINYRAEQIKKL